MPLMDGFELTSKIKMMEKIWKVRSCPIIAVTACISNEVRVKASEVGMINILLKPVTKDLLHKAIRKSYF
jgi:CheY-like chemotaxis protein